MIIRQARLDRGWSQRDLADRLLELGVIVPVGSIGYIERHGTTSAAIAKALSLVLETKVVAIARLINRNEASNRRRAIKAAIKLLEANGYRVEVPS